VTLNRQLGYFEHDRQSLLDGLNHPAGHLRGGVPVVGADRAPAQVAAAAAGLVAHQLVNHPGGDAGVLQPTRIGASTFSHGGSAAESSHRASRPKPRFCDNRDSPATKSSGVLLGGVGSRTATCSCLCWSGHRAMVSDQTNGAREGTRRSPRLGFAEDFAENSSGLEIS